MQAANQTQRSPSKDNFKIIHIGILKTIKIIMKTKELHKKATTWTINYLKCTNNEIPKEMIIVFYGYIGIGICFVKYI